MKRRTLVIEIEMENAATQDLADVAEIVKAAAEKMVNWKLPDSLMDANGNVVGSVRIVNK